MTRRKSRSRSKSSPKKMTRKTVRRKPSSGAKAPRSYFIGGKMQ